MQWFEDGEKNTRFFHMVAKENVKKNSVCSLKDQRGDWVADEEVLGSMAVSISQNLYSSEPRTIHQELLDVIPNILSVEELKGVVMAMSADSAPGPDFFHATWDIIKHLGHAAAYFLEGCVMPRSVNATVLSLIPKITAPSFSDFRPISLCNFFYKIIRKLLALRLGCILPILYLLSNKPLSKVGLLVIVCLLLRRWWAAWIRRLGVEM